MSCVCDSLTEGIRLGCDPNSGGNRRIYITESCNVTVVTPSPDLGYKEVTLAGSTKYFKLEFIKNKGNLAYTEDKPNGANGSEYYVQTVTLKLHRREKSKRAALLLMTKGKSLSIIVQDNNGLYWLIGEFDGAELQELKSQSGENKTDMNGYTLTFIAEENYPACEISATYINTLASANDIDEL